MQNFNYHTHTYRCGHADNNMNDEDYVKAFIENGFKKIAFTDHCPQKDRVDTRLYMRMKYCQTKEYLDSINALKKKYAGIIEIETGFEVEYLPGYEENLFELKNISDKLILGQHYIYNKDRKNLKVFRINKFSNDDLITYAKYIKTAMELNLVNVIAHPDLFMLSSDSFDSGERKATEIICQAAERTKIPLEINLAQIASLTANPCAKVQYPCRDFWEIASKYNLNVIYGIDAHNRFQIDSYKKSVELTAQLLGEKTVSSLNFITL